MAAATGVVSAGIRGPCLAEVGSQTCGTPTELGGQLVLHATDDRGCPLPRGGCGRRRAGLGRVTVAQVGCAVGTLGNRPNKVDLVLAPSVPV
jgi:hypothetical protein